MTLNEALHILVQIHTRDDDGVGFTFSHIADVTLPWFSSTEYAEAWRTVREHLHLPTEPAKI